jgi:hypothetical protein
MVSPLANGGSLHAEIKGLSITDAFHSTANDFLELGGETTEGRYLQNWSGRLHMILSALQTTFRRPGIT